MDFTGIIAEYDPFHNGHAAQLAAVRAAGAQCIAVCMSSGAVQRGGCLLYTSQGVFCGPERRKIIAEMPQMLLYSAKCCGILILVTAARYGAYASTVPTTPYCADGQYIFYERGIYP